MGGEVVVEEVPVGLLVRDRCITRWVLDESGEARGGGQSLHHASHIRNRAWRTTEFPKAFAFCLFDFMLVVVFQHSERGRFFRPPPFAPGEFINSAPEVGQFLRPPVWLEPLFGRSEGGLAVQCVDDRAGEEVRPLVQVRVSPLMIISPSISVLKSCQSIFRRFLVRRGGRGVAVAVKVIIL